MNQTALEQEIMLVLNANSAENDSNTPDFILAQYLMGCLAAWNAACKRRDEWGQVPETATTK